MKKQNMMSSRRGRVPVRLPLALAFAVLAGCAAQHETTHRTAARAPVITEAFVTTANPSDNLDSPAVWHAPDGSVRVYVTAKGTDSIAVFDGATGAALGRIGRSGRGEGELKRPNGVFAVDDLLFVVERDNHRVQVFALPDAKPLGTFDGDALKKPYGLWIRALGDARYRVYVTDDWQPADVADADAAKRVVVFDVDVGSTLTVESAAGFGDATGPGRLRVVESIVGDVANDRLLVADEFEGDGSRLKLHDLDGRFLGRDVGLGDYRYQAEGFALYACADGSGYWIGSDQSAIDQRYLVFDRRTLAYVGAVRPRIADTTDGVWLDQRPSARFPAGAFYASHHDDALAAFDWRDIAAALGLRSDCRG